jgi:signal peptidase I
MQRSARRLPTVMILVLATLGVLVGGVLATGRAALVATHGVSMNPVYYQGDLVVVAKADTYQVGQIVAYRVPAKHMVVLHRIIRGDANGFVIKGDNNESIDPLHPTAKQLIGRAVLHVPHGGLWLSRLTSPVALALIALTLTVGGGTAVQTRRTRRRAVMSRHANRSTRSSTRSVFTLSPGMRTATAAAGTTAVLGLALGALAWTASADQLRSTATQATRQLTFSYTAAVARTPAYDDTTVHSPDPVFRRLTNTVELHLAYQGSPGNASVTAELSTPGGWHTTVSLAGPVSFTANRYESTVRLDLKALDARAQAAAVVTGLPTQPLTLAIVPSIRTAGNAPFTPTLKLNLNPLQLTLAGDATSLTVRNTTTVSHPARIPGTLNLLGRHIPVAQARILSAILLFAALLAAAVLALIARLNAPRSEGAAIRYRYGPLLASVQPITAPPDLPVVEVTEFATLAKLAERSGVLVLHWSRSDIETFIVRDEGTTYRYRTGAGTTPAVATFPVDTNA